MLHKFINNLQNSLWHIQTPKHNIHLLPLLFSHDLFPIWQNWFITSLMTGIMSLFNTLNPWFLPKLISFQDLSEAVYYNILLQDLHLNWFVIIFHSTDLSPVLLNVSVPSSAVSVMVLSGKEEAEYGNGRCRALLTNKLLRVSGSSHLYRWVGVGHKGYTSHTTTTKTFEEILAKQVTNVYSWSGSGLPFRGRGWGYSSCRAEIFFRFFP